jgi:excisionase family DNA binding protein
VPVDNASAAAAPAASLLATMEDQRFLTLDEVAGELATSKAQVYALVRRKELRAIKLGGRGQWRVAREDLEAFLEKLYTQTSTWIDDHPFVEGNGE